MANNCGAPWAHYVSYICIVLNPVDKFGFEWCKGYFFLTIFSCEKNTSSKSTWEVIRQLSSDKQQSTLFTRLEIPWRFQSRAVLRWLSEGLCHARKCQFEDLDKKKRYDRRSPNGRSHKKPLESKAEQGKNAGTYFGTRFPQASYFEKMRNVCQKHGGVCTTWYPEYKRYKNGMRNWHLAQPRRVRRN